MLKSPLAVFARLLVNELSLGGSRNLKFCVHQRVYLQNLVKSSFHSFRPNLAIMPPKNKKVKAEEVDDHALSESENESEPEEKQTKAAKSKSTKENNKGGSKKVADIDEENDHVLSQSDNESEPEEKQTKGKRKATKAKAKEPNKETKKRGTKRGAGDDEAPSKKVKAELVKPDLKDLNFDCDKETTDGKKWNFKISTWNVAGLRAWVKKNGIEYIKKEDPDIICLQETKCPESKLPPESKIPGYHTYWVNGVKDGYAGVAIYSKVKPLSVKKGLGIPEHDSEGRVITAEYEKFYLVATYVPNAGQGLKTLPKRLKWDTDFRNYLKDLDSKKPVILCGDLNVAHNAIDLANPATNTKHAGFTQEERDGMTALLKEGFVDTFRHLYPDKKGAYTFWAFFGNARARNTGWRLDYFVLSERFLPHLCDNVIRNQVHGSDHCPVTLFLNI